MIQYEHQCFPQPSTGNIHPRLVQPGPWPSALQTGEDRSGHGSPEKRAAGSTGLIALALARIGGARERQPLSSPGNALSVTPAKKIKILKKKLICCALCGRSIELQSGGEGWVPYVVGKDWGCKEGGEWTMGGKGILVRWRGGAIVFRCGWRYVPLV